MVEVAMESSNTSSSGFNPLTAMSSPIAICGMAVRLPGGISNDYDFWQFLLDKRDAISRVPKTRYDVTGYHSKSGRHGTTKTEHGYFLNESVDLGTLDTSFFSFTRLELEYIDPQQRQMLEVVRECFDSAGEVDYRGKDVGCFVGSFGDDWTENLIHDQQTSGKYPLMVGGDFAIPNRISYEYDLHGPSLSLRTACSSSLVALHHACLSIERGECSSAIVAGYNLIITPTMTLVMSAKGVLSPDGSCKSFDANADGYGRGEAINAIYIKPLESALRDGNPVRAVIRGSAVNSDGKSTGFTVPSADAQEDVIRKTYHAAGIMDLSETGFVECHGTGTSVGDPIEVSAIANAFGDKGIYIGSVKPNVGHSEGASGLTSVIKAVLAVENRIIPPNIKFKTPNPKIPFEAKKIKVPVEATPWPKDRCFRASVNSFGMGGVNSHVIIESSENFLQPNSHVIEGDPVPRLLVFSANTQNSLDRMIQQNLAYLTNNPDSLRDLAYTLGARREHLPYRAASLVRRDMSTNTTSFGKGPSVPPQLVMVFGGQGSQWPRMGFELLKCNSTFRNSMLQMDSVLQRLPNAPTWSIVDEISKGTETSNIYLSSHSQPICTALQIALVDALYDLNIKPFAVIGHSSGELAAAYAAGRLTAKQAVVSAFYRGVVAGKVENVGCMAAVGIGRDEADQFLRPGVVIACENSPSSVTISGDIDEVQHIIQLISKLRPEVPVRLLKSDTAYHSHHMLSVGETYCSLIDPFFDDVPEPECQPVQFFSTLTGDILGESIPVGSKYWKSNLESPVLFHPALKSIVTGDNSRQILFLEVSPHSTLSGPIRQTMEEIQLSYGYVSCLSRFKNCAESFLYALGQLYSQMLPLDFKVLTNPDQNAKVLTNTPTYPWHHNYSSLYAPRQNKEWRFRQQQKHELLGMRVVDSTDNEPCWRNVLYLEHVPWLRDHRVSGNITFPAAGYIMMAGEAVRQINTPVAGFHVRNMDLNTAMVLNESKPTEIVTSLRKQRMHDGYSFTISSHNGVKWVEHCSGEVFSGHNLLPTKIKHNQSLPRSVDVPSWYKTLRRGGIDFGPVFQGMEKLSCSTTDNNATAKIVSTLKESTYYPVHPAKLDAFLHSVYCAVYKGFEWQIDTLPVPTNISEISIRNCTTALNVTTCSDVINKGIVVVHGEAYDGNGDLTMKIKGAVLRPVNASHPEDEANSGAMLHWKPSIKFLNLSDLINSPPDSAEQFILLNSLTSLCIEEALSRLDKQEILPTNPTLRKYQDWLRRQSKPRCEHQIGDLVDQVLATSAAPCARAMMKVLDYIIPICKGDIEALEVLMGEGTLYELYNYLNEVDRAPFFDSIGHFQPQQRILEIGAGTGGTTAKVLSQTKYSTYTFTDISAAFFPAAKDRFKSHSNMMFKTLNITKDPFDQGFEPASFDLIIAANVLHATPTLRETLTNIRKLLHPQGKLLMEELCGEAKFSNFITGLLPGWWVGESDGRADEPYISPDRWEKVLEQSGFNGLDDVALNAPPPFHTLAFMLASPCSPEPVLARRVTLLSDTASSVISVQVQKQLRCRGYSVRIQGIEESLLDAEDIIVLVDIASPFFTDISSQKLSTFQLFLRELQKSHSRALWVTRSIQVECEDPRFSPTLGVARTIRSEFGIDFATCEVDAFTYANIGLVVDVFESFRGHIPVEFVCREYEYVIREATVHVGRLFPFSVQQELSRIAAASIDSANSKLTLDIGTPGSLKSLVWTVRELQQGQPLNGDEVEIKVDTVGVNYQDILSYLKLLEGWNAALGLEAAGVVVRTGAQVQDIKAGDQIAALGRGAFATSMIVPASQCIKTPEGLSLTDAVTMPLAFSTAIRTLCDVGQLTKEQTILIHSACGGVGLAAIQIGQMVGATIYATVSNDEKVEYLTKSCGIPRDHILSSRDSSFRDEILRLTNGRGVDLVLNSLSKDLFEASCQCVAKFGKLIDLAQSSTHGHAQLPMSILNRNITYIPIDMIEYIECRPEEGKRLLEELVNLFNKGNIRPITPVHTFLANDAKECFAYMQTGQHIGKLIVSLKSPNTTIETICPPKTMSFRSDASYLLVGGLGGLGGGIARWMVELGARHLIFLSRTADAESNNDLFRELESQCCSITAVKGSVCNKSDVKKAISFTANLKGIFNMSMVLQDVSFLKMSLDEWNAATGPKVQGTWNLHEESLGHKLDFFLLFGSMGGMLGIPGQANYGSANTFLDAFVQFRHRSQLPASVIDIGAVQGIGHVADNPEILQNLKLLQYARMSQKDFFNAVTVAISHSLPTQQLSGAHYTNPSQFITGLRDTAGVLDISSAKGVSLDSRLAAYFSATADTASSKDRGSAGKLKDFLSSAATEPAILSNPSSTKLVAKEIAKWVFDLLMKPVEDDSEIDLSRSLIDVGLDSLAAVEMRSWLKGSLGLDISVLEIMASPSLAAMGEYVNQRLICKFGGTRSE